MKNMKKLLFTIVASLCLVCSMAEDVVQVRPFSTTAGVVYEDEAMFDVEMVNTNSYQAMEFNIFVPAFIHIDTEGVEANPTRMPGPKRNYQPYHTVSITDKGNGHYYVTLVDINPDRTSYVSGNDGVMFSMYYTTDDNALPGIYPIRVEGTVLGIDGNNGVYPETSVSYVKIGETENSIVDLGDYYVPSFVEDELAKEKNIIAGGKCLNFELNDAKDFVIEKPFTALNILYNAEVSASLGYKTLVLPYDCDVPAGFEAYEVGSLTGNTLNMVQVLTITADKPVILKNAGIAALTAENVTINATSVASLANGILEGTYTEMLAPVGSYVLQNIGGNVAFYPVAAGQQPTVGAFRAYLSTGASQAKSLKINFDSVPTGIDAVEADTDVMTYNINGQRISDNSKGLRIVRSANGVSKRIK